MSIFKHIFIVHDQNSLFLHDYQDNIYILRLIYIYIYVWTHPFIAIYKYWTIRTEPPDYLHTWQGWPNHGSWATCSPLTFNMRLLEICWLSSLKLVKNIWYIFMCTLWLLESIQINSLKKTACMNKYYRIHALLNIYIKTL